MRIAEQNNMKIVQTTGIVKNGEIKVKLPQELNDGEVDVIVVAQNEPDEFEELRASAKTKGYDSKEKILELIGQVKQEMLADKGRIK
jgi:lipopolysaccharide export system protein LptA